MLNPLHLFIFSFETAFVSKNPLRSIYLRDLEKLVVATKNTKDP